MRPDGNVLLFINFILHSVEYTHIAFNYVRIVFHQGLRIVFHQGLISVTSKAPYYKVANNKIYRKETASIDRCKSCVGYDLMKVAHSLTNMIKHLKKYS